MRSDRKQINSAEETLISEIYGGVDLDMHTQLTEQDGKPLFVIEEKFGSGTFLNMIEQFVRQVESSDDLGFKVVKNQKGSQVTPLSLASYFQFLSAWSNVYFQYKQNTNLNNGREANCCSEYVFSSYVTAFFDACRATHLLEERFTNPSYPFAPGLLEADAFNILIETVRKITSSLVFKRRVNADRSNLKRNFKSYANYFNRLLSRYSRLLVLRVDLFFSKEETNRISVENAHEARKRFLNNMRQNELFSNLRGLIWKLEWGSKERGHHFHFIFFFDGRLRQKDEWLANQIGLYWVSRITDNRGSFNNCNQDRNKYKRRGIGMINYNDMQKRETFLSLVLGYLIKQDQCLMVRPSKGRTIGRGEIPRSMESKAGRPRKYPSAVKLQVHEKYSNQLAVV